jgi:PAS domain S-box-containing protein
MKRILIINEHQKFVESLRKELTKQINDVELFFIGSRDEIVQSIERLSPDLILINFKLIGYDYLTTLALVKKDFPSLPILFYNDEDDEKQFFKSDESFLFSGLKKLTSLIQGANEKTQTEESDFVVQSMRKESSLFKRLSSTLNSFPDLILIQDSNGIFIDYFSNIEDLLPIKPKELLTKNPGEVFPLQLASKFESLRKKTISGKNTNQIELSLQFENTQRIVEFRFVYLDEMKTAVILRDITERKVIETNLTQKAIIADNLDTPVIALDLSFRITYLNPDAEKVSGVNLKNCKGKKLDSIFKIMSLDITLTDIKKELELTGKWVGELVAITAEGRIEPINFSFCLLKNSKGIPVGITAVHRFVKKEISFVHFDERSLPIFMNLSDGIAILQDGFISYSNNAFSRMTGYDENQVKGKSFIEFLHEEDELFIRNYFSKNDELESFVPGLFEIRFIHKNHINVIYAEVTFDVFAYKGIPSVIAVVKELQTGNWSLNVNDMKSDEDPVQNDSSKRTALAAYMNHDIRTSLNGILGFADILREELKDQKERTNFIYADKIYSGGKRLLNLLSHGSDFQKIESAANVLQVKEIQLVPLIDEVVSLLQLTANQKKVKIISTGIIQSPIFADENRLFEALNNIVGNAIERSENNTITIQAMHVKGKPKVQIVVKDSGQILTQEKIDAVTAGDTEKSFSLDDAPEPTLFRLAISKRLISFMNGEFEITSLAAEGTKSVITLPAAQIAKSEITVQDTIFFASSSELMFLSQRQPKILIIEDDESSRKMLEITLTKVSRLTMAENGEDALKKIEEKEKENDYFQLVLMDIGLPGPWDGLKLRAEILRRWNHYRDIPFIAQTAFALKSDRDKITESGFNDYLPKPIDRKFLIKTIYNQLK